MKSQSQIQGWGEQGSKTEHRMMALSFMSSGVCWLHRTDVIIRNYHLLHQEGSTERERKRGLILAIMSTRLLFAVIMGWGSFTRSDPPVFVSSKMFCVKGFFHSSLPKRKTTTKQLKASKMSYHKIISTKCIFHKTQCYLISLFGSSYTTYSVLHSFIISPPCLTYYLSPFFLF